MVTELCYPSCQLIFLFQQSIIVKPEEDGRSVRNSQDSFEGRKSVTFHGASPRGESLSVYFLKQQQVAKKVLKKKQRCFGYYEEYVFAQGVEPPKKLFIGARPFETKVSYFDFLDMFCSVSFSKVRMLYDCCELLLASDR